MSGEKIDERVVDELVIDLASLSDASHSDPISGEKGEEEVSSSKKRISREESERRKTEDLLIASGTEFFKVYRSYVREEDLDSLRSKFGIPEVFELRLPTPDDRPDSPPEGFLCLYVAQLEGGLRFHVSPIFADISNLFKVPLNQFAPKAFSIIVGFYILVQNLGDVPSAAQFHSLFMLKKTSPGLFYFNSRGDAHFLSSVISIKEWKRHYFFISTPTPWSFPRSWIFAAPDLARYSTRTRPAPSQQLLKQLNLFRYDPRSLAHPVLLSCYGLSPKEVALDTATDKALGTGKGPGGSSSSKRMLTKSPPSTPASSASTADSRGKKTSRSPLPPRLRGSRHLPALLLSLLQNLRPALIRSVLSPLMVKKEKLDLGEESSLLKEEGDDGRAFDFIKGLLSSSDRRFLEDLTPSHSANLLASSASKTILLIGDLLERGGRATEGALKKVEELEEDIRETERRYEPSLSHLRSEVSDLQSCLEHAAGIPRRQAMPSSVAKVRDASLSRRIIPRNAPVISPGCNILVFCREAASFTR
ncbi:UNVERIFIED_CONTAM: hypothetical protein Slati_3731800 [Sesamum latifolium]|uniref:Uncharacterized protein n=1 Tax=Sesamum latifolium TaxID=2727402 RepID=A0AAW2U6S4_9LAMI